MCLIAYEFFVGNWKAYEILSMFWRCTAWLSFFFTDLLDCFTGTYKTQSETWECMRYAFHNVLSFLDKFTVAIHRLWNFNSTRLFVDCYWFHEFQKQCIDCKWKTCMQNKHKKVNELQEWHNVIDIPREAFK